MKSKFLIVLGILFVMVSCWGLPASALSTDERPIRMGRPTWDTEWFQAEIFRLLLQDLGYSVEDVKTYENEDFYQRAASGQVDLWLSAWMPTHQRYLTTERTERLKLVGRPLSEQLIQGFLIEKSSADQLQIKTLEDFKRPEVIQAFDLNKNGKADLLGCDLDWNCYRFIQDLLDHYDLSDSIEQISGTYTLIAKQALKRIQKKQPTLFYTWAPHWAAGVARPGEESYWLPVPLTNRIHHENASGVPVQTVVEARGCRSEPCDLGFFVITLEGVANARFLERHPDIQQLMEDFYLQRRTVSLQNASMYQGKGDLQALREHAQDWLKSNHELVQRWLKTARQKQQNQPPSPRRMAPKQQLVPRTLKVATYEVEPFVVFGEKGYQGFSIELWNALAEELNVITEWVPVTSLARLMDEVERHAVDVAVTGLSETSERELRLDFSKAYFESGLHMMMRNEHISLWDIIWRFVANLRFVLILLSFFLVLLLSAHVIWWSERQHNPEFPQSYFKGVGEGLWWSLVTLTTVGYGDKTPKRFMGKFFAALWMLVGYFIFAYFTASVTTAFTLESLQREIRHPRELHNQRVLVIRDTLAQDYLQKLGVDSEIVDFPETAYAMLLQGEADVVVHHTPSLQYYARNEGQGKVRLVGNSFARYNYGFALHEDSPFLEELNVALLKLQENGVYDALYQKWFGLRD